MFNKNDPLIDSVSKIMKENQIRRDVEQAINEELGIHSKKDLPFQSHAEYDAVLEEAIQEALKGNQHKIDLNKNKRIDSHDFKLLRSKKEKKPEEHGVEAEREMASKGEKIYEANKENKEKKNAVISKIGFKRMKETGAFHGESPKRVGRAVLAKEESEESDPASLQEKAPPGAKFERMVKHIKDKYKKGGLTDKEKSIAYATAWKAKNKEEELDEEGFIDTMKKVFSSAATGGATPAGQPKPTTSLALGGASTQASAPPAGAGPGSVAPAPKPTATPFTKGGPAVAPKPSTAPATPASQVAGRAAERSVPTPSTSAKPGEERMSQTQATRPTTPAPKPAPKFGAAFAAARQQGAKEFEWQGKKYNTAMKGETPAQRQAALTAARTGGRSGPTGR